MQVNQKKTFKFLIVINTFISFCITWNIFIINNYNILNHNSVPKHTILRDDKDIEKILEFCNCKLEQLPVILKDDPVAKLKLGTNGDIFKIRRKSKTCGEYEYYRVCR